MWYGGRGRERRGREVGVMWCGVGRGGGGGVVWEEGEGDGGGVVWEEGERDGGGVVWGEGKEEVDVQ